LPFKYLKDFKSFFSDVANGIKELDTEVNDYKNIGQNPYIPSIAYVNWAMHLVETGAFAQAEQKLLASTLMAHQTPDAYINLGLLKTKEKDYETAIEYFTKAIRLDKNNAKAYCFLANTLTEIQDYKEAEKKFKCAQKIEPNNSDIWMNWGLSLIKQRKLILAREKLQQACKLNLSNFNALYFWGIVELELEEFDKAKEKFQLITSVSPNHSDGLYYLAYLNFREKNYGESLTHALKSLEINPKKIETFMIIGENYMNLKDECNSIKYYEKGAAEASVGHHFLNSWGIALQEFNKIEESKEKFQQSIGLCPGNEVAVTSMGIAYYKTNDDEKAMEYFEKSIEIKPKNIIAFEYLGQIYFEKQDYKKAIEYFEKALKYSSKAISNYSKIANCHLADNNIQKANEYYKKAIEYQPNEIKVYIDFAKALIEQKEHKLAMTQIKKAYKLQDKNIDSLNIMFYLNYILAKENLYDYNIQDAINIAKKIEDIDPDLFYYQAEKEELQRILKG